MMAEAHNDLGVALLSSGHAENTAEVEKEFKAALSLNPHFADAENNLGTLYGQRGDDAQAERFFRDAIRDNQNFSGAMVNLAATLASEARFAEASAVLEQALQTDPGNKEALTLRSMIRAQLSK